MSFESRYKQALNEARRIEPANDEIRVAAGRFAEGSSRRGSFRLARIGGLTVTAGLAVGVFMLAPSKASGLDAMRQALKSVPASHTITRSPNGKKTMEFWREGVKRRYVFDMDMAFATGRERHIFDRGYDGANVWSISKTESKPTVATISDETPTGFGDPGTSIEEIIDGLKTMVQKPVKVTEKALSLDGSEYKQIIVEGISTFDKKAFVNVFRCRKSDGLPVHSDYYVIEKGARKLTATMDVDYPNDLPDDTFSFKPPAGVRVADLRVAKRAIFAGINGRNGSQTVDGVTVNLLGAFEQPDGTTYILWSGGATPHLDGKASVKSESGGSLSLFAPYQMDSEPDPDHITNDRPAANSRPTGFVPFGRTKEKPMVVNPFMKLGDTPVYALQVNVLSFEERPALRTGLIAPAGFTSTRARTLDVQIPVFKKSAPRTLQYGTKGAWFQSDGMPVGTANFKVETIPVEHFLQFIQKLGIDGPPSWAGFPFYSK